MRRQENPYDPDLPQNKRVILACLSQVKSDSEDRWVDGLQSDKNNMPCMVTNLLPKDEAEKYTHILNIIGIPASTLTEEGGQARTQVLLDDIRFPKILNAGGDDDLYFKYIELIRRLASELNSMLTHNNKPCPLWTDRYMNDSHENIETLQLTKPYGADKRAVFDATHKQYADLFAGEGNFIQISKLTQLMQKLRPDSAVDLQMKKEKKLISLLEGAVLGIPSKDKVLQEILTVTQRGKNKGDVFSQVLEEVQAKLPKASSKPSFFKANKQVKALLDMLREAHKDNAEDINRKLMSLNADVNQQAKPGKR